MRSALWAEWIIARLTDRSRAASIVGDLLETTTERRSLSFWFSVAGIVLSLVWRRAIAFVVAFYFGLFWRSFAIMALFRLGQFRIPFHPWDPTELVVSVFWFGTPWGYRDPLFSVVWFGTILCTTAAYAVLRYGFRDRVSQLALGLCTLATIVVSGWQVPLVTATCIALALATFVASIRSDQRKVALVTLTVALALEFAGTALLLYLRAGFDDLFWLPLMRSDMTRATANIAFFLLLAWITTTAFARMHDRLLRHDQQSTEVQSPS